MAGGLWRPLATSGRVHPIDSGRWSFAYFVRLVTTNAAGYRSAMGRRTVKVLPVPVSLSVGDSTQTSPP